MPSQNATASSALNRSDAALARAKELHRAGRLVEAEAAYLRALQANASNVDALQLTGALYQQAGHNDRAGQFLRRADQLDPNSPETVHNLAVSLGELGQLEESARRFEQALALAPDYALAWKNSGIILQRLGRLDEAIEHFRRAFQLDSDVPGAHSALLFCLNHSSKASPESVFAEHRRWGQHHERQLPAAARHENRPDPDRRLRIGYLSPDFQRHAVAQFVMPLMEFHDRERFELTAYANVEHPDAVTERFRSLADRWQDIWQLPDDAAAALIRADEIDILVDLAGHTKRQRLLVAARRPAPVQITYVGYPNTTGLDAIDYRLTDRWADPPGMTEHLYTEELLRLPGGFLCYQPPDEAPDPVSREDRPAGLVTFGSFNKALKLTTETLELWGRLLREVPGASLLLKSDTFSTDGGRRTFGRRLSQLGIPQSRVELLPATKSADEHLRLYSRVDIALDPTPYNGTTTTCEALWMGVPVIALVGKTHASRVGLSIMHAIGLPEFATESPAAYMRAASELAADAPRRAALRVELRARMRASTLCDGERTTREIEAAYRSTWQRWCADQSGTTASATSAA